ncbi:MAG: FemAB family XrtA/PEP-CTERM system-associated protein [Pseudomonadota bacterium]
MTTVFEKIQEGKREEARRGALRIEAACDADAAAWDRFVGVSEDATFFHRWGWGEFVKRMYGYEPVRFVARRGNDVVGLAPFSHVKSPLLGHSLISTAFTVGGGVVADDDEAAEALALAAQEAGVDRRVQYVEIRGGGRRFANWLEKCDVYASFEKVVDADPERRLKAIPRKRRAEVRKALKLADAGKLRVRFGRDLRTFYTVYARSARDLGTPVFSMRYAERLLDTFGADVEIAVVEAYGEPVAALMSFYDAERVMPYYVGASPDARRVRAFDYLYWMVMERAVARGRVAFDFGRSKIGTPHYHNKTLWGFSAEPLRYQYALVRAKEVPNVNPQNPKFKTFSAAWKHMPLPLATLGGPLLARHLA